MQCLRCPVLSCVISQYQYLLNIWFEVLIKLKLLKFSLSLSLSLSLSPSLPPSHPTGFLGQSAGYYLSQPQCSLCLGLHHCLPSWVSKLVTCLHALLYMPLPLLCMYKHDEDLRLYARGNH